MQMQDLQNQVTNLAQLTQMNMRIQQLEDEVNKKQMIIRDGDRRHAALLEQIGGLEHKLDGVGRVPGPGEADKLKHSLVSASQLNPQPLGRSQMSLLQASVSLQPDRAFAGDQHSVNMSKASSVVPQSPHIIEQKVPDYLPVRQRPKQLQSLVQSYASNSALNQSYGGAANTQANQPLSGTLQN